MRKTRFLALGALASSLVLAAALSAAPGDLDPSFGAGGKALTDFDGGSDDRAYGAAVQTDGKVVVVGEILTSTQNTFAVARYTTSGALDASFDGDGKVRTKFTPSSNELAEAVAIQSDGKIVVAGIAGIPGAGTASDFAVVRYNADGSPDTSFDADGKVITDFASSSDWAYSVAIQADGKILLAGTSRAAGGGQFHFALARYNSDGSLDPSFGGNGRVVTPVVVGGNDFINAIALQRDGKIVAGGQSGPDPQVSASLARYLPDGTLDVTFDGDGKVNITSPTDSIFDLAVQPDGKIVTAGAPLFSVSRFNVDGSVDTTLDGDGNARANLNGPAFSVALQRDGKIVAAGPVGYPVSDFALARFNPSGAPDDAFGSFGTLATDVGSNTDDWPSDLAVAPDGKLVVIGRSGPASGQGPHDFAVVRYLAAPPPCKVPNVRGKKLSKAKASIRRARCRIGKVTRRASSRSRKGRVLSQRPKAGTLVPEATRVNLVIGRGRR